MEKETPLNTYLRDARQFVCLDCTLKICAEGDEGCLYAVTNADAIRREKRTVLLAHLKLINEQRHERHKGAFTPDTRIGLKYDKRRKADTPRRRWERAYRKRKREQEAAGC